MKKVNLWFPHDTRQVGKTSARFLSELFPSPAERRSRREIKLVHAPGRFYSGPHKVGTWIKEN